MAVSQIISKYLDNFKGEDLSSNDIVRAPGFASSTKNASINRSSALTKSAGYKYIEGNIGGVGMSTYKQADTSTGAITETVVNLDDDLHTLVDDSFDITYTGSATVCLLNISVDSSTNKFKITISEDEVDTYSATLGLGFDESSTTTISTTATAINALSDFTATSPTDGANSAAFLDVQRDVILSSTATTVNFKRWEAVNTPTSNPLATHYADRNSNDFENASFANINNTLYISTELDNLHKYDGQNFYRAGLPAGGDADGSGDEGTAPTLADTGSGSTFATSDEFFYFYTYIQHDNKGNIIEGEPSPYSAKLTKAANDDNDVTVTNISSSSGFNTGCAIVDGAQNGVTTITVDSGHTLNSGDTAYFYDGNTSAYVTKTITSTTATTIVFSGSVDVADNAVISNNLRIAIYRTDDSTGKGAANGEVYSLVAEIPNDSIGSATQTYTDQITDANIGAEFVSFIKPHSLPPKGRYLISHQRALIIAGNPENVNTFYRSDVDSPEYFPLSNSQTVAAYPGSKIRGLGSLQTSLIVLKDASIIEAVGDLDQDAFRTNEVPFGQVGCVSHDSIKLINGMLFFLSREGVYAVVPGEGVTEVGKRINPRITRYDTNFNLQKSTSINWINDNKYILFIPEESLDGSDYYTNSNSICLVYDYSKDSWWRWSNYNAMGGWTTTETDIFFTAKRLDSDSENVEMSCAKFLTNGHELDMAHHHEGIDYEYSTHWETLGEPSIYKTFLYLKSYSLPSDAVNSEPPLFTHTVEQEFNFNTPAVLASFPQDHSGGALGYGLSEYGNAPYGDDPIPEIHSKLKTVKSKSMRITFKNSSLYEGVLLSGYEFSIAANFKPKSN